MAICKINIIEILKIIIGGIDLITLYKNTEYRQESVM